MTDVNTELDAAWADAELARLFADTASVPDPYPLLEWLRENSPVRVCNGIHFVSRYQDVNALFRDQRLSRHEAALIEAAAHGENDAADPVQHEVHEAQVNMMINLDEPAHNRVRRILDAAFRPKAVAAWRPRVEAITAELIDAVAGQTTFDLLADLAYPLPERVICDLLGVPHADHELWTAWTNTSIAAARTGEPSAEQAAAVADAHRAFFEYFRTLVKERRADLSDDLVSVLIRAEDEGDRLSELELLGSLQMLIAAGHETTANLLGNGMWRLLTHPEEYERLRADPSLVPAAVEEMLRFETPSHWSLPRMATEDIPVADTVIKKGSLVMLAINSANRDAAVCPYAEQFDIGRENNRHIAFAAGPHFCLGAMLARQEAQVMLHAIVTRLPRLELAEEPVWKTTFVRALRSLRVRVA